MPPSMPPLEPITPDWPDAPANIGALCTTRVGGLSEAPYDDGRGAGGLNLGMHVGDRGDRVARNRALLRAHLPGTPVWLSQVHGVTVLDAALAALGPPFCEADAVFASVRGAVCTIMTADCLPVLFSDLDGSVVAAAHAGWRGLAGGVLGQTVKAMRSAGAGEITAWLGPAIGPQQFEVGADVLQAFVAGAGDAVAAERVRAGFVPHRAHRDKYLADIYHLARCLLHQDGVTRIAGGGYCTVSEPHRFYSYRRDGVTGRQACLIWRK
jgi:polyphenol oxidase